MPNYTERNLRLLPADFTIAWRNLHEKWQEINLRLLEEAPESGEYKEFRHHLGYKVTDISVTLSYNWDSGFKTIIGAQEEYARIKAEGTRIAEQIYNSPNREEERKKHAPIMSRNNFHTRLLSRVLDGDDLVAYLTKVTNSFSESGLGNFEEMYPNSTGVIKDYATTFAGEVAKLQAAQNIAK